MAEPETTLIIPQQTELVTKELVQSWYARLEEMADNELERRKEEGALMSPGERELEKHKLMLGYCDAISNITEQVRQQILTSIHRKRLNEYSPEGWSSLGDVIRDALPSYNGGTRHQLATIAEDVAPWCEEHGIDIYKNADSLWKVNESASFLNRIISDPDKSEQQKVSDIKTTLDFIDTHNQGEVKGYVRKYQGVPARAAIVELSTGESAMIIVGGEAEIQAIAMRIGNLATRNHTAEGKIEFGELRPSKARKRQFVRDKWTQVRLHALQVLDEETGELLQEIE